MARYQDSDEEDEEDEDSDDHDDSDDGTSNKADAMKSLTCPNLNKKKSGNQSKDKVLGSRAELSDILTDHFDCPLPERSSLMDQIKRVYHQTKGRELGTVRTIPLLDCVL
jgi:hypothetical protein